MCPKRTKCLKQKRPQCDKRTSNSDLWTYSIRKNRTFIELAKKINGEIVSADSMQIYKDMNIGTAKPTPEEMQGIKHYLIDFISPNERYSVADYKKMQKKQ